MSKDNIDNYRDLISYKDAEALYSVSYITLKKLAVAAGAVVSFEGKKKTMINCSILEAYFEKSRAAR